MAKIYIVYYSTYGHVCSMAKAVKEGIDAVEGCEAVLYQVAETLPAEVLAKMHAPPKQDVPIITANDLEAADGLVFGFPTRFGMMCAQMKAFFDSTGSQWQSDHLSECEEFLPRLVDQAFSDVPVATLMEWLQDMAKTNLLPGALLGKPVTAFTSTGTQGGGQETTLMTSLTQFVHHGMIYVPPGYSYGGPMFSNEEVRGGSPWGAGCYAGADGSRQPSDTELGYAKHQGTYFAGKVLKLAA